MEIYASGVISKPKQATLIAWDRHLNMVKGLQPVEF
jgi:hypothetical protein